MREQLRAELLRAIRGSGVDPFQLMFQVLDTMPEDFVFLYEVLWLRVYGEQRRGVDNPVAPARRVVRVNTSQTETRGAAKPRTGPAVVPPVANQAALLKKRSVDRKLRAIARELKVWLDRDTVKAGKRQCTKCKKYAEDTWVYCPWDGARTEEVT